MDPFYQYNEHDIISILNTADTLGLSRKGRAWLTFGFDFHYDNPWPDEALSAAWRNGRSDPIWKVRGERRGT